MNESGFADPPETFVNVTRTALAPLGASMDSTHSPEPDVTCLPVADSDHSTFTPDGVRPPQSMVDSPRLDTCRGSHWSVTV